MSSPPSSPASSSDMHPAPSTTPPHPFPGETFLSTWTNIKFFLGAPDPHTSSWATLAAFYGTGTAHLSTCRLVFILDPPPPSLDIPSYLSIPLVWLQPDRLKLRHPFFDVEHLTGVLVPADVCHTPISAPNVFSAPGKPMEFRMEALDPAMNKRLCIALRNLLSDPDRVARDTRVLRHAADTQLVPTNVHFAFVDPKNPAYLHLTTLMTHPDAPDLVPH